MIAETNYPPVADAASEHEYTIGVDSDTESDPSIDQGEVPSWNVEQWVSELLQHGPLRDANAALNESVKQFLKMAETQERELLASVQKELQERFKQVKMQDESEMTDERLLSRRRRSLQKIKSVYTSFVRGAYEYSAHVDVFANQAPEYVGFTWAGIKILLEVQINHLELKDKIQETLMEISEKFEIIKHITEYLPRHNLVRAIGDAYAEYSNFLSEALKFYKEKGFERLLKDFSRPWRLRFLPIVNKLNGHFQHIRDISQYHGLITSHMNYILSRTNQARNKDILELSRKNKENLDEILKVLKDPKNQEHGIKFADVEDANTLGWMIRQFVNEKLENAFTETKSAMVKETVNDNRNSSTQEISDLTTDVFPELQAENEEVIEENTKLEGTPGMEHVQEQRTNILRTGKVMAWLESESSQLLWIDGNHILQRANFTASFIAPLMIDAESNYGSCLFLRHFCKASSSPKKKSYNILLQALVRQLLEQRPRYGKAKSKNITRERTADADELWSLLIECIQEVKPQCTFIVIDGIDKVYAEKDSQGKDIVIQRLEELVKKGPNLVKVLLTSRVSDAQETPKEISKALITTSARYHLDSLYENKGMLTPYKFAEFQERRATICNFRELHGLYLHGTTIYTKEMEDLRAFWVEDIDRMEQLPFGRMKPLVIQAFYFDHNGISLVRKRRKFSVPYFEGNRKIRDLEYVPAGYLKDEYEERAKLLERGNKYLNWSSRVHYKMLSPSDENTGATFVIDQEHAPKTLDDEGSIETSLKNRKLEDLKPLTFMLCPSRITGFSLTAREWTEARIDTIEDPQFDESQYDWEIWKRFNQQLVKDLLANLKLYFETEKGEWKQKGDMNYLVKRGICMRGCKVLLWGPRNAGKKWLVYALSHLFKRPVLQIATSSLRTMGEKFEQKLDTLLRYAEHWGCFVLYRDEYSLIKNTGNRTQDQEQNVGVNNDSLKSVLIQKFESFRGVLFATAETNASNPEKYLDVFTLNRKVDEPYLDKKIFQWNYYVDEVKRSGTVDVSDNLLVDMSEGSADKIAISRLNGQEIKNVLNSSIAMARSRDGTLDMNTVKDALGTVSS